MLDEAEYRRLIQGTLDRIEDAFENVDPDLAECEQQFGALTIKLKNGARCILSAQPSVRQLWMAVASRGAAFHFNYDPLKSEWRDDKGLGIEVTAYLRTYLQETVGLRLVI